MSTPEQPSPNTPERLPLPEFLSIHPSVIGQLAGHTSFRALPKNEAVRYLSREAYDLRMSGENSLLYVGCGLVARSLDNDTVKPPMGMETPGRAFEVGGGLGYAVLRLQFGAPPPELNHIICRLYDNWPAPKPPSAGIGNSALELGQTELAKDAVLAELAQIYKSAVPDMYQLFFRSGLGFVKHFVALADAHYRAVKARKSSLRELTDLVNIHGEELEGLLTDEVLDKILDEGFEG